MGLLGIPEEQLTQPVKLALSVLMEKLEDQTHESARLRESLTEMEQLVDVDCLAPVPNRRAFLRRLNWAIAMHKRYGHPSCVLFFDLNGFKEVNDGYGHAAGDEAIRHVSQLLKSGLRDSDFMARLGGDEFAIIMYYAKQDDATRRGNEIVANIAAKPFIFNGNSIALSSAFGVYELRKGDDPESALSQADTAMYMDKRRSKPQLASA